VELPEYITTSANKYRSENDPTLLARTRIRLVDTPGHGKLRQQAMAYLGGRSSTGSSSAADSTSPIPETSLKGILFVVDAAALHAGSPALRSTAEYLHDTLLTLQRRYTRSRSSKHPASTPVLVLANKSDLFTALPALMVRAVLEAEIEQVRSSRRKGIAEVGASEDVDAAGEEDEEWLGGGEGFTFETMKECDVDVQVVAGSVRGQNMDAWWEWIGERV